jgi:hypothetical protein
LKHLEEANFSSEPQVWKLHIHTYLVIFDVAAPKEGIDQYRMKLLQNKKILNETIKG